MTQLDLYKRMSRILHDTAACPVRIALEHFNVEWRPEDTEKMGWMTDVIRCPGCLQWIERFVACNTKCKVRQ